MQTWETGWGVRKNVPTAHMAMQAEEKTRSQNLTSNNLRLTTHLFIPWLKKALILFLDSVRHCVKHSQYAAKNLPPWHLDSCPQRLIINQKQLGSSENCCT